MVKSNLKRLQSTDHYKPRKLLPDKGATRGGVLKRLLAPSNSKFTLWPKIHQKCFQCFWEWLRLQSGLETWCVKINRHVHARLRVVTAVVPVRIVHVLVGTGAVRVVRAAVLLPSGRFRGTAALGYELKLVLELALERHLLSSIQTGGWGAAF